MQAEQALVNNGCHYNLLENREKQDRIPNIPEQIS
jgi:hypothetical protein